MNLWYGKLLKFAAKFANFLKVISFMRIQDSGFSQLWNVLPAFIFKNFKLCEIFFFIAFYGNEMNGLFNQRCKHNLSMSHEESGFVHHWCEPKITQTFLAVTECFLLKIQIFGQHAMKFYLLLSIFQLIVNYAVVNNYYFKCREQVQLKIHQLFKKPDN